MGSPDGVGIGQGLRERGVPSAGTHGDLLSAEPALGSGSGEGEGSLAHPCFLQGALSSVVGLTAWLCILSLQGPCFLLECLEKQKVPWLHLCHRNELHLGGGIQPCSYFGLSGANIWVLASAKPRLGFGSLLGLSRFKFSIRPRSL